MERGSWSNANEIAKGLLPAVTPVVFVFIGSIDPGKWAIYIDVGARFGGDLVAFALVFSLVGVLCNYLSARVSVVTGRSLTQICPQEYDRITCFFLGVLAEASVVSLDLTMILGISHGLNIIFGLDLFSGILVTGLNSVLYPLFSTLLESSKANVLVVCLAGLTIICYVLGMLSSLPEFPASSNSLVSKLSGENAFALMGLLGSNVMPHNFYLYSSIVQRYQGPARVSINTWSQDNLILNFAVSSSIFLVNYVLMNSAANAFYSTGLGLLSFQDAMSLVDQACGIFLIPFASFVLLFLANQIVAASWEFCGEGAEGGESMLHDFFNLDLPEWLHRVIVRIFAVVAALFCLWYSGPEGMYHFLICTQVMVALLLPSSVIPLFRISSSRPIMGTQKISPFLEFIVLLTFMGMVGLELMFVVEMIFGESEWVGNLRWSINNGTSLSYTLLLATVCISLFIMIWLAATPLKSSSSRLDSQPWNWDSEQVNHETCIDRENNDVIETKCLEEEPTNITKDSVSLENSLLKHPQPTTVYDDNLPDTIMETTQVEEPYSSTRSEVPASSSICHPEQEKSSNSPKSVTVSGESIRDTANSFLSPNAVATKPNDDVEETLRIEGELQIEKQDDGESWDPVEPPKDISGVGPSTTTDGPGSFKSHSGKSDDGETSTRSLSGFPGLGRAARRQLAAALDEFWGQLYDFHGQLTKDATAKNLDMLFGVDSKPPQSLSKSESVGKDFVSPFESDSLVNSVLYDTPKQQKLQKSLESAYRAQRGSSSSWSNQMQLLDTYMQRFNHGALDLGDRGHQSMRLPPTSESLDYQPATVHGYELRSYLNRMAKENAFGQLESIPQKLPTLVPNINYRDSLAVAFGQKSTNGGVNYMQPSGFQNIAVQRNNVLQSDTPSYGLSAGPIERMASQNNTKKYHSLPDISGLSVPLRNSYSSDRSTHFNSPNTSMGFGPTVGRTTYEQSPFPSNGSRPLRPLAFDELSPYRGSISYSSNSGANSLWSKQPFEQFGLANDTSSLRAQAVGNRSSVMAQEPPSVARLESKLLQSLRHCILKLLKLEGSEWLFRANEGVDEDLIDQVATRERFLFEVESQGHKQEPELCDSQYQYGERKVSVNSKGDETHLISSVPHCGEGCVWKVDLIVSFGVWCIRRVLELSLMESRPELWGKYTYVLNRLQGVIDMAFLKPRTSISPCFCLQILASCQTRSSPPVSNSMLPPAARQAKGKLTTASMMLDTIKNVETAISCRRGRSGTAAGDVAFPKGKENLASVLKRYRRRLSNRAVGPNDSGPGSRKLQSPTSYGS